MTVQIDTTSALYTMCCAALARETFLPQKNVGGRLNNTPHWQFAIHVAKQLKLDDRGVFDAIGAIQLIYWGLSPLFRNR